MAKPLADQVVVITGASSGIGRCTAAYMARRGACVVVTSRWREALESLVDEIQAASGCAVAIPGDVRREKDMAAVADTAFDRFGRIDTWVNNAGVYIQGRILDLTLDDFRAVLETDLVGVINGTRQALRHMIPARSGTIIQISSILGRQGAPYSSPYSAAKSGIEGFCDAVRAEIWGSGVHVCTLYLSMLDTPIYQHARSRFDTKPKPVPPIGDPVEAARKIAELAENPKPLAFMGWFRHFYLNLAVTTPRLADWFLHHTKDFTRGDLPADGDNLERPMTTLPPAVRGGWGNRGWKGFTVSELMRVLPLETMVGAATLGFLAARLWPKR